MASSTHLPGTAVAPHACRREAPALRRERGKTLAEISSPPPRSWAGCSRRSRTTAGTSCPPSGVCPRLHPELRRVPRRGSRRRCSRSTQRDIGHAARARAAAPHPRANGGAAPRSTSTTSRGRRGSPLAVAVLVLALLVWGISALHRRATTTPTPIAPETTATSRADRSGRPAATAEPVTGRPSPMARSSSSVRGRRGAVVMAAGSRGRPHRLRGHAARRRDPRCGPSPTRRVVRIGKPAAVTVTRDGQPVVDDRRRDRRHRRAHPHVPTPSGPIHPRRDHMAKDQSFDVVSQVDMQEVDNAVQQASKELTQRYDLKDSGSTDHLRPHGRHDLAHRAERLRPRAGAATCSTSKLVRRTIDLKAVSWGKIEAASGGSVAPRRHDRERHRGGASRAGSTRRSATRSSRSRSRSRATSCASSAPAATSSRPSSASSRSSDYGIPLQFVNYR